MSVIFPVPPMPQRYPTRREPLEVKQARVSVQAPRVPWDKFLVEYLDWKQGEHFGLIGPTGLGKTTMLNAVLPLHPYVVVFATKPRDESMNRLINEGYLKMDRWVSLDPEQFPRRVLWPDATRIDSDTVQAEIFHDAFARIYREGNWTVAIDETWWVENRLKLGKDVKSYLLQGRSLGISLIAATQRPAWVPREIYTQSTHLMFWRTNDETDLQSLSGIGWRSAALIREIISNLEMYQVLYINTRTGMMCRTRCPKPVAIERN